MSGISYRIDDRTVMDAIDKLLKQVDDPTDFYDALGNDLAELTRLHFHDGEDPYGVAWPAPVFRSGQPLRDTGRLMNSITHEADSQGVDVGTNVCYASVHQRGMTITAKPGQPGQNTCGRRKGAPYLVFKGIGGQTIRAKEVTIPARPFLPDERGLPDSWQETVLDRVSEFLNFKG